MPKSVYIHIPFCKSKCRYCSFVSFENLENIKGFIYSLLKEIDSCYQNEPLQTLYIGGGTPSVLPANDLEKIVSKFCFAQKPEITIEVNPNDADKDYLKSLYSIGFNRLSMGAQSFDDRLLKLIGRRHSATEIINAVENARNAGFDNISLDLIYGLPEQTLNGFIDDVNKLISLDIEHMSLYGLKIEEGCYFYTHKPENIQDEDMQADMYLAAGEITGQSGFEHYEISNYAKAGYASKHNMNYWRCGEYYGFGVSAHGYVNGLRYANTSDLKQYLNSPDVHEYGRFLTEPEKLEERIFLGLRLSQGIDVKEINNDFVIDFDKKYSDIIKKYTESAYLLKTNTGYRLSDDKKNNGFLISNLIMSAFMVD